jgi:hypothetical protein
MVKDMGLTVDAARKTGISETMGKAALGRIRRLQWMRGVLIGMFRLFIDCWMSLSEYIVVSRFTHCFLAYTR